MNLETAKKKFQEELTRGTTCPCCERNAKIRTQGITTEMAYTFMILCYRFRQSPRFYSTRELFPKAHKATTDAVHLVHWGLIAKETYSPRSPYMPTDKGLRFYNDQALVPTHVHTFNNKLIRVSDKKTSLKRIIQDSKYDYDTLMSGDFR
jgi:hypothetical protein